MSQPEAESLPETNEGDAWDSSSVAEDNKDGHAFPLFEPLNMDPL